jgi:hypothetical protein
MPDVQGEIVQLSCHPEIVMAWVLTRVTSGYVRQVTICWHQTASRGSSHGRKLFCRKTTRERVLCNHRNGELGARRLALFLVPRDTQCMEDQMVLKCQQLGVQGHVECVSNVGALCEAPGFVMGDAFAVRTGRIGTVWVFVLRYGLSGHRHRILLDSRQQNTCSKRWPTMRKSSSGALTTATRTDNAPNPTDEAFSTSPYRPNMIAST